MSEVTLPPGIDPAWALPRADLEYLAWEQVRHLGNVITRTIASRGNHPYPWWATTTVQVDCRATTRDRAWAMADMARQILCTQPFVERTDTVIVEVVPISEPAWLPDENAGPRFTARYEFTHHPRQVRS